MNKLSAHEQGLLEKLSAKEWKTQRTLRTSRQSLNKLVRRGLAEERFVDVSAYHAPEIGREYKLIINSPGTLCGAGMGRLF